MQEQYAVPKHKFEAEIKFSDQKLFTLTLFLSQGAAVHMGPERPSDILNGPISFLPAVDEMGNLVLVNRDMMRIASVPETSEFGADEPVDEFAAVSSSSVVEVAMDDGTTIVGTVSYVLPQAQSRLQDYLNSQIRFLIVRGEGLARFVNRRFVSRVTPLEASGKNT